MSRIKATTLFFLLVIMVMVSCSHNSPVWMKLQDAQNKIVDYPDSALAILQSIPGSDIRDGEEKALYGMLYIQAMDKNHLDPDNDSIIAHSVEYYNANNKTQELIVSTYYRGRVLYHAKNYPQSLLCFYKAKELAEQNNEYFWAGMSCRGISDVYKDTYHFNEEVEFAKKGYDFIKTIRTQPFLNNALYDYSMALRNSGNIDMSIEISKQLLDSANKYGDTILHYDAVRNIGLSLVDKECYEDALPVMNELCGSDYAVQSDSLLLSLILSEINRFSEAESLFNEVSSDDDLLKKYIHSKIESHKGNYLNSFSDVNYINLKNDSVNRSIVSQTLTTSLANYLELNRALDTEKVDTYRKSNVLLFIITSFLICLVIYLVRCIIKRYNEEINNKVLFAERLKDELVSARNNNYKSYKIVETLLSGQHALLEQLIYILVQTNDSKKARKKIADTVTKLIKDLSIGGEKVKELEERLDMLFDNVFSDFKRDFPNLKENDYLLFLCSAFQISPTTISILLKEEKIEAVYNRKRRLKNRIIQLNSAQSGRYLKFLSQ